MPDKPAKWVDADTAIQSVDPRGTAVVGMIEPGELTAALARSAGRLRGLRVAVWPLIGPQAFLQPGIRTVLLSSDRLHSPVLYMPVRSTDTHRALTDDSFAPLTVLIHVSVPDEDGWCSFGLAADYTYDIAVSGQATVIAECNAAMPYVPGEARIHVSQCDRLVRSDRPIAAASPGHGGETERAIGTAVAAEVPGRATLQIGVGKLPDAAVRALTVRRGLGIQSGVVSDAIIDLHEAGAVDGRFKSVYPGLIVTGSLIGSQRLHAWAHRNASLWLMPLSWIHRPEVLAADPRYTSLNTGLQVDLTGQINAESIRGRQIGNAGGLANFQRAGAASPQGRGILALRSLTAARASTIVSGLAAGDPVTSLRADTDVVITEFGTAHLFGRAVGERAGALIQIAHPTWQPDLTRQARDLKMIRPD